MNIDIQQHPKGDGLEVITKVELSRVETSHLFVTGDLLIQLPTEGMVHTEDETGAAPMERSSMFLSEMARQREGYSRTFSNQEFAEEYVTEVKQQLQEAQTAIS